MSTNSPKPLRRRGSALEAALLKATWQELKESGYEQLTFDKVAHRAGTSKTVLYRRWPNRLALVHAALRAHQPLLSGYFPDTGSLRGDVIALLEHMMSGLDEFRIRTTWSLFTDAINANEQHTYLRDEIASSNTTIMKAIIDRAQKRGEIDATTLPKIVITLPIDLVRHEFLVTGEPPTKATITQIVDDVFLPAVHNVT